MDTVNLDPEQLQQILDSISSFQAVSEQIRIFLLWQLGALYAILVFTIFDPLRKL